MEYSIENALYEFADVIQGQQLTIACETNHRCKIMAVWGMQI